MRTADVFGFGLKALGGARLRTGLMLLAMSIGVAAVVMLTALGEGARRYVVESFSGLGTHLLIVLPGRSETTGAAPPIMGETPRDLTLDDALSLARGRDVAFVAPLMIGSVPASNGSRQRDLTVIGSTWELLPVRHLRVRQGSFLPKGDADRASPVVVLGEKTLKELFGHQSPLGAWIRLGDRRFRVIGVLEPLGQSVGTDFSDIAIIPVASAQALLNTSSLFRILVQAKGRESIPKAREFVLDTIRARHEGEDDVTVIAQDALLTTFDGILRALTYTLGAIAAVSLAVAGILIMNVMLVAVSQRIQEIGLLKALGASQSQVLGLFLAESALLSVLGTGCGLLLAQGVIWGVARVYPAFPIAAPLWAPIAAAAVAIASGLLFGWLPARRASRLDPVLALAGG